MMDRRAFITMGGSILGVPLVSEPQPAGRRWRIGYLDHGSAARNTVYLDGLRRGLRELGWGEDQNITIDPRFAEGQTDRRARG